MNELISIVSVESNLLEHIDCKTLKSDFAKNNEIKFYEAPFS